MPECKIYCTALGCKWQTLSGTYGRERKYSRREALEGIQEGGDQVNHIDPNLLVALCTGLLSFAGAAIVAKINASSAKEIAQMKEESTTRLAEKKDKAQQELVSYKIDKLTEKVEKHNNVVENVAILQHDMSTVWMRYDDMKKLIDSIKKKEE